MKFGSVDQEEMSFKEKVYGHTLDERTTDKNRLEPWAQVSFKHTLFLQKAFLYPK